jgi:hypothetical protein
MEWRGFVMRRSVFGCSAGSGHSQRTPAAKLMKRFFIGSGYRQARKMELGFFCFVTCSRGLIGKERNLRIAPGVGLVSSSVSERIAEPMGGKWP